MLSSRRLCTPPPPFPHRNSRPSPSHLQIRPRVLLVLVLVTKRAVQSVVQDVAEGEQTDELAAFVDDYQAMHARLADGVEDGVESIVQCACIDAREVLI